MSSSIQMEMIRSKVKREMRREEKKCEMWREEHKAAAAATVTTWAMIMKEANEVFFLNFFKFNKTKETKMVKRIRKSRVNLSFKTKTVGCKYENALYITGSNWCLNCRNRKVKRKIILGLKWNEKKMKNKMNH